MMIYDVPFILLHMSVLLIVFLLVLVFRMRNKAQIHYIFLCDLILIFIWNIGQLLEVYYRILVGNASNGFIYLYFIGVCFLPSAILFTGIIFAKTKIKINCKHALLLIPPLISYLMLLTNESHHLFLQKYSAINDEVIYGKFFYFHNITTYCYIIIGLYFLLKFSIRNSGFFSKQSILIFIGIWIPFSVNVMVTYRIVSLPTYFTVIAFSLAIMFFMIAIMKYEFLNIIPIALQNIVDHISDAFVVLNEDIKVVDYNQSFSKMFGEIFRFKRNDDLEEVLKTNSELIAEGKNIADFIIRVCHKNKVVSFERHVKLAGFNKYFTVEITPIGLGKKKVGTIILLKDITQNKVNLKTIKEKQAILMEQERLASLGHLIGGIAHNLKTPIMSIAGAIEGLMELVKEYEESVEDLSVTPKDHYEIAGEMQAWLDKMKPHCAYMSDIITAVKGQTVRSNRTHLESFSVGELVKKVEILMKHELMRNRCTLKSHFQIDLNTLMRGEVNNLVQIIDNMIINAIQSYEGKAGVIEFEIIRSGDNVEFCVKDYGKGISEEVRAKLFKEMVTTKGKNGTGLGLYISYSMIKGYFGGNMSLISKEGIGTKIYISIPSIKSI